MPSGATMLFYPVANDSDYVSEDHEYDFTDEAHGNGNGTSSVSQDVYSDATTLNHGPGSAHVPQLSPDMPAGASLFSYSHQYSNPAAGAVDDNGNDDDDDLEEDSDDVDMSDSDGGVPLDHAYAQHHPSQSHQSPVFWPNSPPSPIGSPSQVSQQSPFSPYYHTHVGDVPSSPSPPQSSLTPTPPAPLEGLVSPTIAHYHSMPPPILQADVSPSALPPPYSGFHAPHVISIPPAPIPPPSFPVQTPTTTYDQPQLPPVDDDNEDAISEAQAPGASLHTAFFVTAPPPVSLHNTFLGTANPPSSFLGDLPPQNPSLYEFLDTWARSRAYLQGDGRPRFRTPWLDSVMELKSSKVRLVERADLAGDCCDAQGIDWAHLGVTRRQARERRLNTYKNFINLENSDVFDPDFPDRKPRNSESYFRYRRMHVRRNVKLNHFQLRSVLATSGRNRSYYPTDEGIRQINPLSGRDELLMDMREMDSSVLVSTLSADSRVLVAGTFNGEYCIKNLRSEVDGSCAPGAGFFEGQITDDSSGITTHVQVHSSRTSSGPLAAFASNDRGFRTLDVGTQRFVLQTMYNFPVNCSALSPDRRLRVMVGDHYTAVVTNAETGEVLQELRGHRDYGFACDWADDGWTVATGSQDMTVKIWDARKWGNASGEGLPVHTLRSEMAGVRGLKFSPLGSGKRVLVAAEEADFVSVVDARDFARKQTLDVFGEIGGVTFVNGGQDLQVLCGDRERGGLMELERCDLGAEAAEVGYDPAFPRYYERGQHGAGSGGADDGFDWRASVEDVVADERAGGTVMQRRRRAVLLQGPAPF